MNRVAESSLITLDLTPYLPADDAVAVFDLKPFLFREMILKEKDYRAALQTADFEPFRGKHVAIMCSADAVIPMWAYMLAAASLQPVALTVGFGTQSEIVNGLIRQNIAEMDVTDFVGKRIVVKGCGTVAVPESAYVAATARLRPIAKSVMYGEPCSTVPVFKNRDL